MGRRRRRSLDSRRVATGSYALLAAWALVSAAAGHLLPGLAATALFGVLALVCLRLTRLGGLAPRLAGDPAAELARLRGLLEPLCTRAGCAVPEVRVVGFAAGAANARVTRRGDLLTVSRWLLTELPDPQLAAILAHELSHIVHRDVRRIKRRRLAVLGGPNLAAGAAYAWTGFDPAVAPLVIAAVVAMSLVAVRVTAPWHRPLEARADADAVALTGDPQALGLALAALQRRAEELRRRLQGGPPLSWLIAPLVAPARTHPPTAQRIAALGAQPPAA